jgi:hypothetical protein
MTAREKTFCRRLVLGENKSATSGLRARREMRRARQRDAEQPSWWRNQKQFIRGLFI